MDKGLLFTYLLTYGGAVASLFKPFWGLLIYICFSIIRPEWMWYWSVPKGNYSRIIALALLAGWVGHGLGNWSLGKARGILISFIGFWVWIGLSYLQAKQPATAFLMLEQTAKVVLPFLVGITLVKTVAQLKQLAWVITLSQGYVAFEMNLSYFSGFNRLLRYGFGGMDNNCVAIAMVAGVGLAFFLGLNAPAWWQKCLALGAALLMAHSIMFSFSRGGMLSLILTAIASFIILPKQPKHYLIFLLAVLIGVRLAGTEVLERFITAFASEKVRDASAQSRLNMWGSCLDVMIKNPIFGIGPGHWPLIAHTYGYDEGKEAHSLWLTLAAELGVVGLFWIVAFYGLCIRRLWPLSKPNALVVDPWIHDVARMVIASLVGFIIAAQFVSLVGLELPYYVVLLGAGALKLNSEMESAPVMPDNYFLSHDPEGQYFSLEQAT